MLKLFRSSNANKKLWTFYGQTISLSLTSLFIYDTLFAIFG